jgi:hypothetical protein
MARDFERREKEEQNKLFQKSQREDKMKEIQKQEDQQIALITRYVVSVLRFDIILVRRNVLVLPNYVHYKRQGKAR